MNVRPPVAAGSFYPLEKDRLNKILEKCFQEIEKTEKNVIGAIVPHAGYIYSGKTAAYAYSQMKKSNFLIIGPNHDVFGSKFGIMAQGLWATPLGRVEINQKMSKKLLENCNLLENDFLSHKNEHSIEVQLPFLQYKFGNNFKFVPISVKNEYPNQDFLEKCEIVGNSIAKSIDKNWTIIASSDFSHYVPKKYAKMVDKDAIDSILKLDEKEFFEKIRKNNISICGFGPIAIAIIVAKKLGAKKAELLKYSTSGDITREEKSVVGYASLVIE